VGLISRAHEISRLGDRLRGPVALIDAGGPFAYGEDGSTFRSLEGLLPDHPEGYYRE
jgi:ribonuclease T1